MASYSDDTWTDGLGVSHTGQIYTVTVDDPILSPSTFEVQYKLPDSGGDYVVWVETSGGWEQREAEIDGTYLVFQADGDSVVFMVEESGTGWSVLLLAASGCAAAAVVVLILLRVRKGRKGNKRASR